MKILTIILYITFAYLFSCFVFDIFIAEETLGFMYWLSELLKILLIPAIVIITFIFYFLPSIIAIKRKHQNATPIIVFNVFLAWTFLGWVIALIWSLSDNVLKIEDAQT